MGLSKNQKMYYVIPQYLLWLVESPIGIIFLEGRIQILKWKSAYTWEGSVLADYNTMCLESLLMD